MLPTARSTPEAAHSSTILHRVEPWLETNVPLQLSVDCLMKGNLANQ